MVCPSCLNSDRDGFSEIKGCFMAVVGSGYDRSHEEVSMYACRKCSAVMVSGGRSFNQKEVPGGQEK